MNDELIELARRAVACPGWRWMPGMLATYGRSDLRVSSVLPGELVGLRMGGRVVWSDSGTLPDLSDPATLGCLLALVREAWGQFARTDVTAGGWRIQGCCKGGNPRDTVALCFNPKATEAAALVAALEAAAQRSEP